MSIKHILLDFIDFTPIRQRLDKIAGLHKLFNTYKKLEIGSGRGFETSAILDRETFADTVSRDEPVVGREDADKSGSVRVALMEDQRTTLETLAIGKESSRSSETFRVTTEGSVARKQPSHRLARDRVLEIAVMHSNGEAACVLTGEPAEKPSPFRLGILGRAEVTRTKARLSMS